MFGGLCQICLQTRSFSGVGARTPASMTKRHSSDIPGQRVSEPTANDFPGTAHCYHITIWSPEQTNQSTYWGNTASAASTHSSIESLFELANRYMCVAPLAKHDIFLLDIQSTVCLLTVSRPQTSSFGLLTDHLQFEHVENGALWTTPHYCQ